MIDERLVGEFRSASRQLGLDDEEIFNDFPVEEKERSLLALAVSARLVFAAHYKSGAVLLNAAQAHCNEFQSDGNGSTSRFNVDLPNGDELSAYEGSGNYS